MKLTSEGLMLDECPVPLPAVYFNGGSMAVGATFPIGSLVQFRIPGHGDLYLTGKWNGIVWYGSHQDYYTNATGCHPGGDPVACIFQRVS